MTMTSWAPRWLRTSVQSVLCTAAIAAFPGVAHATAGSVYTQQYCIMGIAEFNPSTAVASATVYTDGGGCNQSSLVPLKSSQVSVYPVAWYYDTQTQAWYTCGTTGKGTERKLSNTHTATSTMNVANLCPHGHYISVWAHVAALPLWSSTWYGGDIYGAPVYYP